MAKPYFQENKLQLLYEILRVNHAGEYAACRICEGQISGSKNCDKEKFSEMLEQEKEHLEFFNKELLEKKVRPTILLPIWDKLSYALGYISAKCGLKTGMIAVEAIETVIEDHYNNQIPLLDDDPELQGQIRKFRDEETAHKNTASEHYTHDSLSKLEKLFFTFVQNACKFGIALSKKI